MLINSCGNLKASIAKNMNFQSIVLYTFEKPSLRNKSRCLDFFAYVIIS